MFSAQERRPRRVSPHARFAPSVRLHVPPLGVEDFGSGWDCRQELMNTAHTDVVQRFAKRFDLEALAKDAAHIAATTPSGLIVWVNSAWGRFAATNGGDPARLGVGSNYFAAAEGPLAEWLSKVTAASLRSGEVFESDYECSSAAEQREFRLRVHPVADLGFLITHTLVRCLPHTRKARPPEVAAYARAGVIVMCSNCRRVRRRDGEAWDWVPDWVVGRPPEPVSHGLCAICADFYWRE